MAPASNLLALVLLLVWAPSVLSLVFGLGATTEAKAPNSRNKAAARKLPVQQRVIWINGFPRSGSSFMLSLVSQVNFPVFALFEPCAAGDWVAPELSEKGCGAVLSQLANCNFTGITGLAHWRDVHTLRNGASKNYLQWSAEKACKAAGLVVFKTVTWGHDLSKEAIPFLEANPHVQAISLIRDPRSIYASMLDADHFFGRGSEPEVDEKTLIGLCDDMYKSMNKSHARMLRVGYENLMSRTHKTVQSIRSFMAIPPELGRLDAVGFLRKNVNAKHCRDEGSYSDCRRDSMAPVTRYKKLPRRLSEVFRATESCRSVSLLYGYDVD
mmetsp:Transcript_32675/g.56855  ORF Transcript_32675/g.56855 Transcript_32675/m.56855 type:complete len:326 (+) Transcript_32675:48-1025(+)